MMNKPMDPMDSMGPPNNQYDYISKYIRQQVKPSDDPNAIITQRKLARIIRPPCYVPGCSKQAVIETWVCRDLLQYCPDHAISMLQLKIVKSKKGTFIIVYTGER